MIRKAKAYYTDGKTKFLGLFGVSQPRIIYFGKRTNQGKESSKMLQCSCLFLISSQMLNIYKPMERWMRACEGGQCGNIPVVPPD